MHPIDDDAKYIEEMKRKVAKQSSHKFTKIRLYEKTKELEEAAKEIERLKKEFQDHKDELEYDNEFVKHFTGFKNESALDRYLTEHDKNTSYY